MAELGTVIAFNRTPPKEKMTFEQFLDWCDEDTHAEWVGGEIVMTSPASDEHQDLADFLTSILRLYVRQRGLGWVRSNPFAMRLPNQESAREPDILFVRQEHIDRVHKTFLQGPADLAVEIVSPESILGDRGEKFIEYEEAKIPEYWLIDPIRKHVEFYLLDAQGHYQPSPLDSGIFRSRVLDGFWLKVDWLWQDPLPLEEDVLKEIRGNS